MGVVMQSVRMKVTQNSFALSATRAVKVTSWTLTRGLEDKLVEAMEVEEMRKQ